MADIWTRRTAGGGQDRPTLVRARRAAPVLYALGILGTEPTVAPDPFPAPDMYLARRVNTVLPQSIALHRNTTRWLPLWATTPVSSDLFLGRETRPEAYPAAEVWFRAKRSVNLLTRGNLNTPIPPEPVVETYDVDFIDIVVTLPYAIAVAVPDSDYAITIEWV